MDAFRAKEFVSENANISETDQTRGRSAQIPSDPQDNRPLKERLDENRKKAEEQWAEDHKFSTY